MRFNQILLLLLPIGLMACSHTMGDEFDKEKVAQIQRCQTTKSDLISWFGAPKGMDSTGTFETMTWQYMKVSVFGGHQDEKLKVYLNPEGKVISYKLGSTVISQIDEKQSGPAKISDPCKK